MAFGDNLKRLRKKRGLSQYQLADKIGVTQSLICYYERHAEAVPRLPMLKVTADYFGVTVEELTKEK